MKLVEETGNFLKENLLDLAKKYPHLILNVRGTGTYLAFDSVSTKTRDLLVASLRNKGINMGGSGESAVRIRPMLMFSQRHANIFLEKIDQVLKSMV